MSFTSILVFPPSPEFNNRSPVSSSLLAWQARKFYAKCPSCLPPQTVDDESSETEETQYESE
ncbi:hypothetical protein D915_010474 [Fasciola hepatica]|uniref:Uncharacterized protein n=1 Tax=Fasciola hepatica TaxID=6192 RepID=A0A4E0R9F8_FASHE|nr:hypothetical protein D915_010474 [Fasciola hepatica]